MIEVKHLRLIETIAEEGSLNKAAEVLCLTQSALSHQLKDLERKLEVEIFYRTKNQLHFTPEGKELHDACSTLVVLFENLQKSIKKIGHDQSNWYVHERRSDS